MHNDCPGRRVFAPFKSCSGFDLGGLDEIDTCISHCHVKSDIDVVRPTSVDQVIHASLTPISAGGGGWNPPPSRFFPRHRHKNQLIDSKLFYF